ncbi:MAG: C4-dicarboxylate ABC transporter [Rhodospirillales bacterium]|nr:C4-dicarboxylate ABC transporter [Rhodospirillales bacterium]
MRNGGIGLIIGIVLGIVIGATIIAPRMTPQPKGAPPTPVTSPAEIAKDLPKLLLPRPELEMKMASGVPSAMPIAGSLAKRLDRRVSEVSRGQLDLQFFEPGVLVPVEDLFPAVASGAVDAAFLAPWELDATISALQLYGGFPFGPTEDELLAWLYSGNGISLLEEIAGARGVHPVVCGILPKSAAGWFRDQVEVIADLRGKKIAINGLGAMVLSRIGAKTRSLDLSSVKEEIHEGRLDAAVFSVPSIDRFEGFQTVLSNYYFPGWQRSPGVLLLIVNSKRWAALRSTQRIQIQTVCGDNVRDSLANSGALDYAVMRELRDNGVNLERWPVAIRDELSRTWTQIVEEESSFNADFRRVWTSLAQFREGHMAREDAYRP